jgi:hypothetical protein
MADPLPELPSEAAPPPPPEASPPTAPAPAVIANGTVGRVYARPPLTKAEEEEERRKRTLERLREQYGKDKFYDQLAEYDPQHADWWRQMSGVQQQYHAAEAGYDAATRAYSESMRETLHQSTINLFENPAALSQVNANGSSGLYDWYVGMHRTAFDQNGAWNSDFIARGTSIARVTPMAMYTNAGRLVTGDSNDPHAKAAAEQVRQRRAAAGLRVSMRPGQRLPESKEADDRERERLRAEEQFRWEHPILWALSRPPLM